MTSLALSRDCVDPRAFRFARNQREAGIEHLEWENRIKPLRPLSYHLGLGLGLGAVTTLAAMCFFI